MESFYALLGGPRTFWGGSNKVIINNFGAGPMFPPMGRPHFMHHHCSGYNRLLGWMTGMNLLSNIFGSFNRAGQTNYNLYNQYGALGQYNPYLSYGQNNSLTSRLETIENEVKSMEKQIEQLQKNQCDCQDKEVKLTDNQTSKDKVENSENTQNTENTENSEKTNKTENTQQTDKVDSDSPKTLDEVLNNLEGFTNLDKTAQDYVKNRITNAYQDENGNLKYDIKATVHDGDTAASIISRFYSEQEQKDLSVMEKDYNAQTSGKKIKNPRSGDTINANGVSEYGLKALMDDAKQSITRDGEIQKTNKKMNELKEAFKNGEKKLSKEYVLQNHFMTEDEYNKIIESKYSAS